MTWILEDNLTTSNVSAEISSSTASVGSNTGTPINLMTTTKTSTEWGGLEGWESAKNNSYGILQTAIGVLQSTYDGKEINLDGLYITLTDV